MKLLALSLAAAFLTIAPASGADAASDVTELVEWLFQDERRLDGIPFSEVVRAATGFAVLPIDRSDPEIRRVLDRIGEVLNDVLRDMNAPGAGVAQAGRINEASRHLENAIRAALDAVPGFQCGLPPTRDGRTQHSGYPDLRLVDEATGRVFYLDPKLFAGGSRDSTFRTFYYEPKHATSKVLEDAIHLAIGIEHARDENARTRFVRWELIDLSQLKVRLKAEFAGSNRDLYRPEAVVGAGAPE